MRRFPSPHTRDREHVTIRRHRALTIALATTAAALSTVLILPSAIGQIDNALHPTQTKQAGPSVVDQVADDATTPSDRDLTPPQTTSTTPDPTDPDPTTPDAPTLDPETDRATRDAATPSDPTNSTSTTPNPTKPTSPSPNPKQTPPNEVGITPAASSCRKPPPLDANAKMAGDEATLRSLVPSGQGSKATIRITKDISLTRSITIFPGTTVTLESEGPSLYGPRDAATLTVQGKLTTNGLTIYHGDLVNSDSVGIHVAEAGSAEVYAGSISRDPREVIPDDKTPTAGAVRIIGGAFKLLARGQITDNAAEDGSAIFAKSTGSNRATVSIANCAEVRGNRLYGPRATSRSDAHGIISMHGADFNLADGGAVSDNDFHKVSDAPVEASTIALFDTLAKISGSVSRNTMTVGGAIWATYGSLTIDKARLIGNTAERGGALHATEHAEVTISSRDTRISNNTATGTSKEAGCGGGLDIMNSAVTLERGSIDSNSATGSGGGVFVDSYSTFKQTGGTIGVGPESDPKLKGNSALYGAGVYVNSSSEFTMSGDALIAGNSQPDYATKDTKGGGVYAYWARSFTMEGGRISNNSAQRGGDVYAHRTPVTITAGTIDSGTAEKGGGVFLLDKASLTVSDATIGDPDLSDEVVLGSTARQGGGIWAADSTVELKSGARISGNTATAEDTNPPRLGAGVYIQGSTKLTMTGGSISGNTTPGAGGGVYVDADSEFTQNAGTIGAGFDAPADAKGNSARMGAGVHLAPKSRYTMSGTALIAGNQDPDYASSGSQGGGVYADKATSFTMEGGRISNNSANHGGNVYASATPVTLTGALIDSGKAVDGGGLWVKSKTELTLTDTVVGDPDPSDAESLGCSATNGGGIWAASSTVNLKGATKISGNTASRGNIGNGGGVFMKDGTLSMSDQASISHNTARISGGGVWGDGYGGTPYLNLAGSGAIDHNISHMVGGGIAMGQGTLNLDVTVTNNTADWWGGGLDLLNGSSAVVHSAVTDNQAGKRGGGVHVGWDRLSLLTVESSATFSGNQAPTVFDRNPYFDKVYADNIHATQWSSGATQGYNGLDIGYNQPPTYTVTFLDFDDTVLTTQKVYPGVDATAPALPDKPGMTFTGWTESFTNVRADITTKAMREYISYSIAYDYGSGEPGDSANPLTYTVADLPLPLPAVPTKTGYTFVGWAAGPNSDVWATVPTGQLGDLTLSAVWRVNTPTPGPMPSATLSPNPTPTGGMPSVGVTLNPTPTGGMPSAPIVLNPTPTGAMPSVGVTLNPTPTGAMPSVDISLNPTPSASMPRPTVTFNPTPSAVPIPTAPIVLNPTPSGAMPSASLSINPSPSPAPMPTVTITYNPSPTSVPMPTGTIILNPTPTGAMPSVDISVNPTPSASMPRPTITASPAPMPTASIIVNPTPTGAMPSVSVSFNPTPTPAPMPTGTIILNPSPSGAVPSVDVSVNPTPSASMP
ncbi:MAG: InlB B-repeat-containing protein, partial [Propionibacteriaceae bacterium]|nr:InlB B-repeat-containing protein [Propionibacteriaceae bacterium]